MADQEHVTSSRASPSRSNTTRWSTVLAARGRDTPEAREALADLCGTYWYPVYAFVRSKGHGPDEAEDLVQGFFARLVEGDRLAGVDPGKGTLRAFLLAACTHFLANEREALRAVRVVTEPPHIVHLAADRLRWRAAGERLRSSISRAGQ